MRKSGIPAVSGTILYTTILCGKNILLPSLGYAGWPGQVHSGVQQALVSALILTSLLLFLIYILRGRKIRHGADPCSRTEESPRNRDQVWEIEKTLEYMFEQQDFAMARLSLSPCRILDATPALYNFLGCSKDDIIDQNGTTLGFLPKEPNAIKQLTDRGYLDTATVLFDRQANKWRTCHVLNIFTRTGREPLITSIVTGIHGKELPVPLPQCISDILVEHPAGP